MNHKKLTADKTGDREILSAADRKICELLGSLNRVEPPKDFDFRVRARIAGTSTSAVAAYRPRFLPVLRYILPLSAVLLISGGFVFNSLYFADNSESIPPIAETNFQSPGTAIQPVESGLNVNHSVNVQTAETGKSGADYNAETIGSAPIKNKQNPTKTGARLASEKYSGKAKAASIPARYKNSNDSGGSRLSALTTPRQIITPPGISLKKTVGDSSAFLEMKSLTPKEVLAQIGVETDYSEGGWKVLAVQENSPAKRSGIKIGDSIEAIDDEKLTDKPLRRKTIEGKKITVRRGGQQLEISLGIK